MPRDGSDIYSQPFPDVVEGTEIESAVYNGFVSDIALDLNTPRPIIAGGTDATNASDALYNLGAERAAQVVTNYNNHVWSPGSFYAAGSATGGPVDGHAFAGICYINEALAQPPTNQNVVVEARDLDDASLPGLKYVREKKAGTWTSWYTDGLTTIGDAAGIASLTGDMFVGVEGVAPNSAFIVNSESDNSGTDIIRANKDGTFAATGATTIGGTLNVTGVANLQGVGITGNATVSGALAVVGNATVGSTLGVTGAVTIANSELKVGNGGTVGTVRFGAGSTNFLHYDGTNYTLSNGGTYTLNLSHASASGNVTAAGYVRSTLSDGIQVLVPSGGSSARTNYTVTSVRSWTTGCVSTGVYVITDETAAQQRFTIDAAGATIVQQYLTVGTGAMIGGTSTLGTVTASGPISQTAGAGTFVSSNGYTCKPGTSGAYRGNQFVIDWNGSVAGLYIDNTLIGLFAYTSDYRTKKDVTALPDTWDKVKALRPVKYTQKEFNPPSAVNKETPMFAATNVEQWGFVAHELQETLTASAANGVKDDPKEIQSPNPWTVIAALTKALQEAMARIEALEAK